MQAWAEPQHELGCKGTGVTDDPGACWRGWQRRRGERTACSTPLGVRFEVRLGVDHLRFGLVLQTPLARPTATGAAQVFGVGGPRAAGDQDQGLSVRMADLIRLALL